MLLMIVAARIRMWKPSWCILGGDWKCCRTASVCNLAMFCIRLVTLALQLPFVRMLTQCRFSRALLPPVVHELKSPGHSGHRHILRSHYAAPKGLASDALGWWLVAKRMVPRRQMILLGASWRPLKFGFLMMRRCGKRLLVSRESRLQRGLLHGCAGCLCQALTQARHVLLILGLQLHTHCLVLLLKHRGATAGCRDLCISSSCLLFRRYLLLQPLVELCEAVQHNSAILLI
mmetsp:Transcript_13119/g.30647  ORF Transcript_13119/g.30647 Transcript_13119/m.30647 type:complete len:232 (+) Transcript_13119:704-1399(+)